MCKSTIQLELIIRIFTNVILVYSRILYSEYDKEWPAVDYGNVHEKNSFNELTENGVREKHLYRNVKLLSDNIPTNAICKTKE